MHQGLPVFEAQHRTLPPLEDQWRAIILFGRNVASYKFALAKALLQLRPNGGDLVRLEDLAPPFALAVCEHLKLQDKQSTSARSAFLDACRSFNRGEIDQDELVRTTEARGFANVIDAFHVVGQANIPIPFFIDERRESGGVKITDAFSKLLEGAGAESFPLEVEARWRLVESAWALGLARGIVVGHDIAAQQLTLSDPVRRRRVPVTSTRSALNGYQQGRCFYCRGSISLTDPALVPDVDHFFPHVLSPLLGPITDGVWNLVLACQGCNRGSGGKFDRLPSTRLVERLHARNEFLITSHHPLRETLVQQTGLTELARRAFVRDVFVKAVAARPGPGWEPN